MMASHERLIARMERCYRRLQAVLPPTFRTEYGDEMRESFRDQSRHEMAAGGLRGALRYWMRAFSHLAACGVRERMSVVRRNAAHLLGRHGGVGRQVDQIAQDVRFALRTLRRRPLFTFVAVLTLGLGIGASTAMFSVVDGVLLRPMPYEEPDRLVAIWQTRPDARGRPGEEGARSDRYTLTYQQFRHLADGSTLYEGLAAYKAWEDNAAVLTGVGDPVELRAGAATASLLPLLGVRPAVGRWFLPGEVASIAGNDGAAVAVISHELWQERFGGSVEVLGRVVTFDHRSFEVVGIMPPGFRIQWLTASATGEGVASRVDVWFPLGAPGWGGGPGAFSWETIGRLAPGVTLEQASVETSAVMSTHPDTEGEARVLPRSAEETRGLAPPLVLLFGATAFLLIIACGNIATLSVAELKGRRHEITARSALGASASRVLRLVLTESAVLAALGTAVGTALAFGGTRVLVALAPPIPRLQEVGVDLRVLGFATLLGTCAAILFGTVPSILASRGALAPALRRSAGTSSARRGFSGAVIAVEVALTAVLLVAGGLLTRSLSNLMAVDPGFDTSGLATAQVRLPYPRYSTRAMGVAFIREALDQIRAIPGIGAVSGAGMLPFPGHSISWSMQIEGREGWYSPLYYPVAPGYFETLGVPLLAGRSLTEADGPDAPTVVVINETMARRFWPQGSPLGARLVNWSGEPATVVGIVGDMKRQTLYAEAEPAFFIPFSQLPDADFCFVARTDLVPREVLPLMREAIWSVDEELVVKNATTMDALVAESTDPERYRTFLMDFFGILAALLAAVGVFGVTARNVAMRTREMGIMMALGAREAGLVGTTVRSILLVGLAGTTIGLTGALWASGLLTRFLYRIEPSDPATYGVVAALILLVCLIASYLPARRISRVSPMEVLKAE